MRKVAVGVSAVLLLAVLGAACFSIFHLNSSLKTIRQQVGTEGNLPFTLLPLQTVRTAFEPVAASNRYTTGAAFNGKLYLAGPGGLSIYNQPGSQPQLLHTGLDLPPAPIVAFATGRLRGAATTSLIAATHGEGLLLFATDGATQQLRPANPADRDITAILPLASGDLLIGTRRAGLLLYDGKTLRLFQPSFANIPVTALAGDEADLWIGTRTRGALHWHAGQLDTLDTTSGLPDPQVEDIVISNTGVFIATPLGVAQFNDGHRSRTLAPGLFAHALALDNNTLLIATIDQGLHQISLEPHAHASQINAALNITHFFSTGDNLLAIADGNLLRQEQPNAHSWQTLIAATARSLADSNVSALTFSPSGQLWIGYFDRGLDVLDLETNRAQHVEDDHIFCINRIVADPHRHTMDAATANGLVLFDATSPTPKPRQVLTRRDGLISDQVTDIAFSNSGMAVATPAGLTFFTASGPQSLYAFQGLANNHVYTLAAEPSSGRVLAGTLGGISILNDATVRQNVTLRNSGLKRNWITAITRVPQPGAPQTWFVGTYGGGVMQMDSAGNVTSMDTPAPTTVINPNAILATPQHVFAGSLDDGLLVYIQSSRHWTRITAGLPSRNVTALAENNGELYVGTENGIVRIAEATLP